ncbi:VOC family protein [Natranaerofaba carboxydovora]|uniref:VOC family protein n=1 Tax=Natranaerofaba carboxydovora TaxID=2742683 RepID=UPI001F12C243|nr:VOC family protein [Natranaerofaba carboxydovora]UMZ73672.1 Glyoxalase/Bleomycin resistance protein/Dioxygenase superfamily protein [Natranaerofaba carboxydovora]
MKFCWCTIRVGNIKESLEFYQKVVGLDISDNFNVGNVEVYFLGKGETKVELIYDPEQKPADNPGGIFLGFEVESLDDQLEFVTSQGLEISGPFQPTPNIKFFFVKDPNGVNIQFVQKAQ